MDGFHSIQVLGTMTAVTMVTAIWSFSVSFAQCTAVETCSTLVNVDFDNGAPPATAWPVDPRSHWRVMNQTQIAQVVLRPVNLTGSAIVSYFDDKDTQPEPLPYPISDFSSLSGSGGVARLLVCNAQYRFLLDYSRTLPANTSRYMFFRMNVTAVNSSTGKSHLVAAQNCCLAPQLNQFQVVNLTFEIATQPFEVTFWHLDQNHWTTLILDDIRVSCCCQREQTPASTPAVVSAGSTADNHSTLATSHREPVTAGPSSAASPLPLATVVMGVIGGLLAMTLGIGITIKAKGYWQQQRIGYQQSPTREGAGVDRFRIYSELPPQETCQRSKVECDDDELVVTTASSHSVYDTVGPPKLPTRQPTTIPKHHAAGATVSTVPAQPAYSVAACLPSNSLHESSTPAKKDNEYTIDTSPPGAVTALSKSSNSKETGTPPACAGQSHMMMECASRYQQPVPQRVDANQVTPKQHSIASDGATAAGNQYTYQNSLSPLPCGTESAQAGCHSSQGAVFCSPPEGQSATQTLAVTPRSGSAGYLCPSDIPGQCASQSAKIPSNVHVTPSACISTKKAVLQDRSNQAASLTPSIHRYTGADGRHQSQQTSIASTPSAITPTTITPSDPLQLKHRSFRIQALSRSQQKARVAVTSENTPPVYEEVRM